MWLDTRSARGHSTTIVVRASTTNAGSNVRLRIAMRCPQLFASSRSVSQPYYPQTEMAVTEASYRSIARTGHRPLALPGRG